MGRYTPPPPTLRSLSTGGSMGTLYQGTALNLTAADTGKNYTLFNGDNAAVTITMPAITPGMAGTEYLFFVAEPTTSGYIFNTAADSTSFKGGLTLGTAGQAASANGVFRACGSGMDRIVIKSGETNGGGADGSFLRITCVVDVTYPTWGVEGTILTADVDSTGAALFVNTS